MTAADLLREPWAFGPVCFVIDDVRVLHTPIPCRGMQGWWPLHDTLRTLALSELAGAPVRSALTLQQPYASAIAIGPKRIENRPVGRHIPPGGLWVGLHAGKTWYCPEDWLVRGKGERPLDEQREEWAWHLRDEWMVGEDGEPPLWPDVPLLSEMPRGAMLGVMHIAACLRYPNEDQTSLPLRVQP